MGWMEATVKRKISTPGDGGFLYIDLLVSITLITLTAAALFSASINLKQTLAKEERAYHETIARYEQTLESDFEEE